MRVLVIADAGTPTGFGVVTDNIFGRLARGEGWDVHVLAINYRGDYVDTPLKLYVPTQADPRDIYGRTRYLELLGKVLPEVVVFINDPDIVLSSLLGNPHDTEKVLWRGVANGNETYRPPIVAYMPIDGTETPGTWDKIAERATRVAMSNFGKATMPDAEVVWHGVDTSVFYPRDKAAAKRALGFDPDRFLVLRVDKNSIRKNYPDTWKALRPILRRHKDVDVHFHCLPNTMDGYNLPAFTYNDEDIRGRLTFSERLTGFTGWGVNDLATLYSAADIFVSTSWGEGFGLTLLEAMACGTPVIATDCSAITEVVGPGGVLIPPARPITVPMGQSQALPDIPAFTEAIERMYLGPGSRRKRGEAAAEHAKQFSWDEAARRMKAIIEREVEGAVQQPVGTSRGDPVQIR